MVTTVLGIGSGLDINSLVTQLVAAEGGPASLRLNRQEAELQAETSAFGLLKSALSEFQTTQQGLSATQDFLSINTASSAPELFTASGSGNSLIGTYSVKVNALAQSQKLASKGFDENTTVIGTGQLTFNFGTYDSGSNIFTPSTQNVPQIVTIDASNNSLQGIRDSINNASIDVTASIVDDGSGKRLVFSSNNSGLENSLKITVSEGSPEDDLDDIGLSQLAFDPTADEGAGKNLQEIVAAQDAQIEVDGLTITRAGNTISGVVEGVTLELLKADDSTTERLSVSADNTVISKKIADFVGSYNALKVTFSNLSAVNADSGTSGELVGDSTLRSIDQQIRRLLNDPAEGLSGSIRTLADIGIRTLGDGTLELDSNILNTAIAEDSDQVAALFSVSRRASDSLVAISSSSTNVVPGNYAIEITQLATQAVYSGASTGAFPLSIDGDNDTFSLRVDGVLSGTLSLTQGNFNSGEDLASEIQAQINGDTALIDASVSVIVDFSNGRFTITSSRFGSGSSIEIVSVDTNSALTLGIPIAQKVEGKDVVGSIGGIEAIGAGRTLSGTGAADGLAVEILGGGLGPRGGISNGFGISAGLNDLVGRFLGSNSLIDSRLDSLKVKISGIDEDRLNLNDRLTTLEARLRRQFTALDVLVAQLNITSEFLTQQLKNLPGPLLRDR